MLALEILNFPRVFQIVILHEEVSGVSIMFVRTCNRGNDKLFETKTRQRACLYQNDILKMMEQSTTRWRLTFAIQKTLFVNNIK